MVSAPLDNCHSTPDHRCHPHKKSRQHVDQRMDYLLHHYTENLKHVVAERPSWPSLSSCTIGRERFAFQGYLVLQGPRAWRQPDWYPPYFDIEFRKYFPGYFHWFHQNCHPTGYPEADCIFLPVSQTQPPPQHTFCCISITFREIL